MGLVLSGPVSHVWVSSSMCATVYSPELQRIPLVPLKYTSKQVPDSRQERVQEARGDSGCPLSLQMVVHESEE